MIKYIGKQARVDKGYTVRSLAAKSTVAPSTIWKYEAGYNLPDLVQLDLLAIALDVDITDLIEFSKGE